MRDFSQELSTLTAERQRVYGIARSSDEIALACFKRGESFAERHPFEHREYIEAEIALELLDNEIAELKREAKCYNVIL